MNQDATIYQEEYVSIRATIWEDDALSTPKNLSGATAEYRIGRKNQDKLTKRITMVPNAAGSVVTILDPTNGILQIDLRAQDTLSLPARRYTHQILVTDSSGKVNVVTDGYLQVNETLPNA